MHLPSVQTSGTILCSSKECDKLKCPCTLPWWAKERKNKPKAFLLNEPNDSYFNTAPEKEELTKFFTCRSRWFKFSDVSSNPIFIVKKNPFENLFLRCCVDPKHLNSPLTMIACWSSFKCQVKVKKIKAVCLITKRVHKTSHSSILWDVSTTDFPEFLAFITMFHSWRRAPTSIPEVGSSK